MKIGVIGEPCVDYIHKQKKDIIRALGGILYSTVSLSVISGDKATVYPIINLGNDEYDNILTFLKLYKNIDTQFINKVDHKTRVVNLYYKDGRIDDRETLKNCKGLQNTYDREESSTEPTYAVEFELINKILPGINSLLINMVSGIDITLDTLKKIRGNFKGNIHIDIHNVVMKTAPDGQRTRDKAENWLDWCTNSDTVQMNETEIYHLTGLNQSEEETVKSIFEYNTVFPKAMIVTREKSGVTLYVRENNNAINRTDLDSIIRKNYTDPTGCGDVLASAFLYCNAINQTDNLIDCLKFANNIASHKSTLQGVEELFKLKELIGK